MAEHLTAENFEEKVLKNDKKVLVDFYAEWCGPCKKQAPIIDELASEGKNVYKLDVDQYNEISSKYGILSIPTLVIFKNGEEVKRLMGFQEKDVLVSELAE